MSKTCLLLTLILPLILLLLGCSDSPETPDSPRIQNLGDTSWTLKALGDTNDLNPVLPSRIITLIFYKSGGYLGSDGNGGSYAGAYKTDGNSISIAAPTFAGYGVPDDPPGFLRQYQTYFFLLQRAHDFEITDEELLINCSDGKVLLFSISL